MALAFFMMWWQLVFRLAQTPPITLHIGSMDITRADTAWLAFITTLMLASLALWLHLRQSSTASTPRVLLPAGSLIAALGSVLVLFVSTDVAMQVVGGILVGAGTAACLRHVLASLTNLSSENRLLVFVVACLGASLLSCLVYFLPSAVSSTLVCFCPLTVGLFSQTSRADNRSEPRQHPLGSELEVQISKKELRNKLIIYILVVFFTYFHTSITGPIVDDFTAQQFFVNNVVQCIAAAAITALLLVIVGIFFKDSALPFVCLLIITTALLLPNALPESSGILASDILIAANRLLIFLLISNVVSSSRLGSSANDVQLYFAIMLLAMTALASQVAGAVISWWVGLGPASITVIAIVVLYIVFITQGLVYHKKDRIEVVMKGGFASERELNEHRSKALRAYFTDLSNRETEVVAFLLSGMNFKSIAKELTISENTAKSHIQHIYSKLDIHSKQELLALVNEITSLKKD